MARKHHLDNKLRGQLSSKRKIPHNLRSYGEYFLGEELPPDSSGKNSQLSFHNMAQHFPTLGLVECPQPIKYGQFNGRCRTMLHKGTHYWRTTTSQFIRKNLPNNQQHCMTFLTLGQLKCPQPTGYGMFNRACCRTMLHMDLG